MSERCALCDGTGQVVTRTSRYGAPSMCPNCGGCGRRVPTPEEPDAQRDFQLLERLSQAARSVVACHEHPTSALQQHQATAYLGEVLREVDRRTP